MRIKDELLPYLRGEQFSNGLEVRFEVEADDRRLRSRISWLEELCADKRIVHVGCVDHSAAQLEHKLARGKWLHARLAASARRCLGVDKDEAGIAYLRDRLGYEDLECADLLLDSSETITGTRWDYLVLGEVLEHTDNPVEFLSLIQQRYAGSVAALIVTVPNAFARENFSLARRGIEAINTDHRYWFTPYTLAKVAIRAKLVPRRMLLCRNGVVKRRSVLKNALLGRFPLLRNNLIMIAGLGAEGEPD